MSERTNITESIASAAPEEAAIEPIPGTEYVRWAYRLLLGRESEAPVEDHPFKNDRQKLVETFLNSEEFQAQRGVAAARTKRPTPAVELSYSVTAGPNGKPLWFCVDGATDYYTRNAGSGNTEFPDSCKFIQRYFEQLEGPERERCFVDVGANIGLYTISVASCGIRTVAIEALARNYLLLCAAIRKNGFDGCVFPIHAAATDEFDLLRVQGYGAWSRVGPQGDETVPGLPVAGLLAMLGMSTSALVKIDVEGYEGPVIAGMRPLLDERVDIDLVVEIFPEQMKNLAVLESYGYQAYLISKGRLIRTSSNAFNPPLVGDYFCTKKPSIQNLLAQAFVITMCRYFSN